MLKIGDFSKLSRVSVRMLRYYGELGLLKPAEIDQFTDYRYYREEQLTTVGRITALRDMGFGLAEVGEMLNEYDCPDRLLARLAVRKAELEAEQREVERRLMRLEYTEMRLREGKNMNYDVNLRRIPERYAACVRMHLPNYEQEGLAWAALMRDTEGMNLIPDDPCICCALFHDGEYKESDVDVEVQKTVKGRYADTGCVQFRTLPAVTVASCVIKGAYEQIGEANAACSKWIEANGYAVDGTVFNIYHVSPHETRNPAEYVTEVCWPVRRR